MELDSKLNEGDKLFLFSDFPYDYEIFPLKITDGVDLIRRPTEHELYQIDNEDRYHPYRYVLPMINYGSNPPQRCIRISSNIRNQDALFFQIILALRLVKPIKIGFSGSFIYTKSDTCKLPVLYWLFTRINVGDKHHNEKYTAEDFKLATKILKKIRGFKNKPHLYSRISMAIDSFGQATTWGTTSYSMAYQELFTCLGILFASEHKAEELGKLVYSFLKNVVPRSSYIGEWVSKNYEKKRNKIAHGNPEFWMSNNQFRPGVSLRKYEELLKLHGIVRLCLLGFLGLKYDQLKDHNQRKLNKLKDFLSKLSASPIFLTNPKIRTDHPYQKGRY